jgi:dynein light chain Tctex-type 1
MAEFDDDQDFNSQQVTQITENAVQAVIGGNQLVYQRDKVNQWTQQIIEQCIKELAKLCKNFKYVVTCII